MRSASKVLSGLYVPEIKNLEKILNDAISNLTKVNDSMIGKLNSFEEKYNTIKMAESVVNQPNQNTYVNLILAQALILSNIESVQKDFTHLQSIESELNQSIKSLSTVMVTDTALASVKSKTDKVTVVDLVLTDVKSSYVKFSALNDQAKGLFFAMKDKQSYINQLFNRFNDIRMMINQTGHNDVKVDNASVEQLFEVNEVNNQKADTNGADANGKL